jgi:mannose-1-phosphate guanylyltransferase/phosphomannomutase
MTGRFAAAPFLGRTGQAVVSPAARIEDGAVIEAPCFIDADVVVKRGARIGPFSVLGRHTHVAEDAVVQGAVLWPNCWVDTEARVGAVLAGRQCHIGRNVELGDGVILGDKSIVTDYSRVESTR